MVIELVFYKLQRFHLSKALIGLLASILTILCFIVLVEFSYFKWQSNFIALLDYFLKALFCTSGLFLSITLFGRQHRIITILTILPGLLGIPLLVGCIHGIIGVLSGFCGYMVHKRIILNDTRI